MAILMSGIRPAESLCIPHRHRHRRRCPVHAHRHAPIVQSHLGVQKEFLLNVSLRRTCAVTTPRRCRRRPRTLCRRRRHPRGARIDQRFGQQRFLARCRDRRIIERSGPDTERRNGRISTHAFSTCVVGDTVRVDAEHEHLANTRCVRRSCCDAIDRRTVGRATLAGSSRPFRSDTALGR